MMKEPILSSRFDVEDIRKLREYNSWRHSQMTTAEVLADIKEGSNEFLREMGTAGLKLAEPPGKYSAK
ncbi:MULTISPECIES: hypothetical protein [unclassified Fibrobacter]|uniref:hypothetical protein n=1 Tax=unclassified Fibrobacter TaxID=2634177 RepID=UPI000D6B418E|nr:MULTISPECIES: hypothetical protein [unclassified Fibrobacter]PWJ62780.1 hypothetical protein BGX12_12069 [Fibrobacter sp. UWR4]PZW63729.1 hypothetical protein C8E88_10419 [Fibrobacter sp. UWR1]